MCPIPIGFTLLRTSEEMIETLEENQIQLQSMMVSKYIGHFFNEISGWQNTLGVVDQVSTDKTPHISIRDVIWMLPSDADQLYFSSIPITFPNGNAM